MMDLYNKIARFNFTNMQQCCELTKIFELRVDPAIPTLHCYLKIYINAISCDQCDLL